MILPIFHYKATCVAPLSSFGWPSALPKPRFCFATKLKDTGTVSNRTRRNVEGTASRDQVIELTSEWAADFYDDESLEIEDVELRTEPIRFWLITFKKPETGEEFYAVVLPDGTIVEPQDEEGNLKSRQTYFAAWQRDRMNAAAVAKYISISAMVIRTCTVTLLSFTRYYIQ